MLWARSHFVRDDLSVGSNDAQYWLTSSMGEFWFLRARLSPQVREGVDPSWHIFHNNPCTIGQTRFVPETDVLLPGFALSNDDGKFAVSVPIWLCVLVTLSLPLARLTRRWRTIRRKRNTRCANCGYDLRATPDRCPECGAVPSDRAVQSTT
jgi:hypothetical protein